MAFASPIPEEGMEAPEAVAYIHDPTGDVTQSMTPLLPFSMSMMPSVMLPFPMFMRSLLLPLLLPPTHISLTPTAPTPTSLLETSPLPPRLKLRPPLYR